MVSSNTRKIYRWICHVSFRKMMSFWAHFNSKYTWMSLFCFRFRFRYRKKSDLTRFFSVSWILFAVWLALYHKFVTFLSHGCVYCELIHMCQRRARLCTILPVRRSEKKIQLVINIDTVFGLCSCGYCCVVGLSSSSLSFSSGVWECIAFWQINSVEAHMRASW